MGDDSGRQLQKVEAEPRPYVPQHHCLRGPAAQTEVLTQQKGICTHIMYLRGGPRVAVGISRRRLGNRSQVTDPPKSSLIFIRFHQTISDLVDFTDLI